MNTNQLRHALRDKWLTYYETNRAWITCMGIWVDCQGQRRPSSGFILGVLSTLEPQLTQMFPFIVELSTKPDRIVAVLGLNFDPDQQLEVRAKQRSLTSRAQSGSASISQDSAIGGDADSRVKLLPASSALKMPPPSASVRSVPRDVRQVSQRDEDCSGRDRREPPRRL